jgi:hypothetical protein
MDRRHFMLLSAGAALLGAPPAHAECGGPSAIGFAEAVWQRQARLQAENVPLEQEEFLRLFSKGMRQLMEAPRKPDSKVILGPVLNAFFGWGVLPRTEVTVGKVSLVSGDNEGPAMVSIGLTYRGAAHKVRVHLIQGEEDMRIANIIYDNGKSLLDYYRETSAR